MIQKMSLDEHKKIANNFRRIRILIHEIVPTDSIRAKMFSCKETDNLLKIDKYILNFKSKLEDRMFRELGESGGATTHIYYGEEEC